MTSLDGQSTWSVHPQAHREHGHDGRYLGTAVNQANRRVEVAYTPRRGTFSDAAMLKWSTSAARASAKQAMRQVVRNLGWLPPDDASYSERLSFVGNQLVTDMSMRTQSSQFYAANAATHTVAIPLSPTELMRMYIGLVLDAHPADVAPGFAYSKPDKRFEAREVKHPPTTPGGKTRVVLTAPYHRDGRFQIASYSYDE